MYKDIFTQAGLTSNEATVYEYLLKNGETNAGIIIKNTEMKRGVVYNALADLVEKGLITQKIKNKVAFFAPDHPEKLQELVDQQEDKLKKAERNLRANLPKLISDFNIISDKPGVKYYEGTEGLKKVLTDVLTSTEAVLTFADMEAVIKYVDKINQKHGEQREVINLQKKVIVTDSEFTRNYLKGYHPTITTFKYINHELYPIHNTIVEIYDGKIAYISLSDRGIISMLITDPNIYKFNKSIFEFIWKEAKKYD